MTFDDSVMDKNSVKHELKQCPRCLDTFECKVGNIALCDCMKVELTAKERAYISKQFEDCICVRCLAEMKNKKYKKHLTTQINQPLRR